MKRYIHYEILSAGSPMALADQVNIAIKDGWNTCGYPFATISQTRTVSDYEQAHDHEYHQAITRLEVIDLPDKEAP